MNKNARNLFITIFLFLFATQSVLACVCEINIIDATSHASMDHDNSNTHHDENHDCEDRCHLSFIELDSGDFIKSNFSDTKSYKQDLFTLAEEAFYLHLNDKFMSALEKAPTFSKQLKPNSLHSQKVLLQI